MANFMVKNGRQAFRHALEPYSCRYNFPASTFINFFILIHICILIYTQMILQDTVKTFLQINKFYYKIS